MQDNNNTQFNIDEKIKDILGKKNFGTNDPKMREYIAAQLGEQAVERAILDIVQHLGEDKFTAFIEFIRKGASRNSLYIYLTSLYPEAENLIIDKLNEVLKEFEEEL